MFEGFLPATLDASDNLSTNVENYIKGGSEYFKIFYTQLPSCQFYPISMAQWMDVRNGVIEVEQQVCQGLVSAQDALDNLQNNIA